MEGDVVARERGSRLGGKAAAILDTFTRNVAQYGYDGTNLSDIAEELSISKGTIVHHYGTKDRLLAALHSSYMRKCIAHAKHILDTLEEPEEQLAALLFTFVLYHETDRDATAAFQREVMRLVSLDPESEGVQLRNEYLGLVRDVMAAGVAAQRFRSVDIRFHSLWMFGSTQWAYTWFDPDGKYDAITVGATYVDFALGSLLIDRSGLAALADPRGRAACVASQALAATPAGRQVSTTQAAS